jgi:hypothetical protein
MPLSRARIDLPAWLAVGEPGATEATAVDVDVKREAATPSDDKAAIELAVAVVESRVGACLKAHHAIRILDAVKAVGAELVLVVYEPYVASVGSRDRNRNRRAGAHDGDGFNRREAALPKALHFELRAS